MEGYGKISGDSIEAFAKHHGYKMVFIDQLKWNASLNYNGKRFHPAWSRVFALPAVRSAFPRTKYIVWFDDDVLVPYPETHMLNHYINLMERDRDWHITVAEEGMAYELNSGMIVMKNTEFSHETYEAILDKGWATNLHKLFGWEQDALKEVRKEMDMQSEIRIIKHREGNYNFNNFFSERFYDTPGTRAQFGDAFVHFLGMNKADREWEMGDWMRRVKEWREALPSGISLPRRYRQYR